MADELVAYAVLLAIGALVAWRGIHARRSHWRRAEPFAGDEHAAPEPAIVPQRVIWTVYSGWLVVVLAGLALTARLAA